VIIRTVRVLLIEDEVRQAAAIRRGLEAENIVVDVVHDGREGLRTARSSEYDAIVLDVMLPGMNGFLVCRELRALEVWTPILMLTAKDGEYDEAEALDTGADDFLTKPFSYVVLLARIRALVRRGAPPRPAELSVGGLVLDVAGHRCSLDGEPVELTARELSILEHLMRRAGDVVSKASIRENVWDDPDETSDNVIEVHVSALRRKLRRPVIETVRAGGYRIGGRSGDGELAACPGDG
jgi:two-component system, OmpR family, response regulator